MAPRSGNLHQEPKIDKTTKKSTEISVKYPVNAQIKENQRPPVYNAEDYTQSLRKFCARTGKNIYNLNDDLDENQLKSGKVTEKRIKTPPKMDCEMSLRQFGSITDLLTKLRADLRVSFPSFVQEFISTPMNGISLLLEVLRAIQLSQTISFNEKPSTTSISTAGTITTTTTTPTNPRNTHTYQRRALLDELTCLQCLSICSSRSPEINLHLSLSTIGLLPLVAAATGQGIRSRIIALQLLTTTCDKQLMIGGHTSNSQQNIRMGHTAVSEALSTLRLRCGEPVRFRLLVGMLNSLGGTGELQTFGLKFINTFLESAENIQNRLYLQAELHQAGFEPQSMAKNISSSSVWLEKIRAEVKRFDEIKIDIDKLIILARDAERFQNQMVILERRLDILQEEKFTLTTIERRLQERCANLQKDIFQLQNKFKAFNNVENDIITNNNNVIQIKSPAVSSTTTKHRKISTSSNQNDDEGISSSETGQSITPEPPSSLRQQHYQQHTSINNLNIGRDDDATTIEDVIEELENIVSDAQNEINNNKNIENLKKFNEKQIVPVNLLPQPPRKTKSFSHLLAHPNDDAGGSDLDYASDYEFYYNQNNGGGVDDGGIGHTYFYDYSQSESDDRNPQQQQQQHHHHQHQQQQQHAKEQQHHLKSRTSDVITLQVSHNTNRDILNVIMDARDKDEDNQRMLSKQFRNNHNNNNNDVDDAVATRQFFSNNRLSASNISDTAKFNGVCFMTAMNTPTKYPRPDVTAAVEAKRNGKNSYQKVESLRSGIDSMIDIVMTSATPATTTNNLSNSGKVITSNVNSTNQNVTNKVNCAINQNVTNVENVIKNHHQQITAEHQQRLQINLNNTFNCCIGNAATRSCSDSLNHSIVNIQHVKCNSNSKLSDLPSGLY